MTTSAASGRQPNELFEFAFRLGTSDGKAWPEEQYRGTERLDPEGSEEEKQKYHEYRLKLAGLLRDQILVYQDPKSRGRTYILKELPEHYHIRRKKRSKEGKDKKDKDVFDFYIYGHPTSDRSGNPRCHNSPNDFFPHLLWLISGAKDKSYCSCKLCNKTKKPEPELLKKRIAVPPDPEPAPVPAPVPATVPATVSAPAPISATSAAPQSTSMRRTASASSTTSKAAAKPASQPQPAPTVQQSTTPIPVPVIPGQHQLQPRPTPQPQPQAARAPAPTSTVPVPVPTSTASAPASTAPQDEAAIFREGEIVWYKHNNAWRIGIVLKAAPANPATATPAKCLVKPLAHAALQIDNVLKSDTDMRPFLAFSVPPVNTKEIRGRRMHEVNWQQMQAHLAGDDRQKQEFIGLEASKMAVVEIDQSYSTFNTIPEPPNSPRQRVGGLFLGAERIAVNEAVRVRLSPTEINPQWGKTAPIVMALRDIYVAADGLHVVGDVYILNETVIQQPSPQVQLPAAMLREQAFRNEIRKPLGTRYDWVCIQQNQDKREDSIRGRFYETSKLMPILDAERFKVALERGIVEDVQNYLNNRLDSSGTYMGRRKNRLETLSTSVPENFFLSLGPHVVED
ncbi:hypothetical protein JX266_004430 [Neoarthrinium moseri]|nr:hypothetical protein JX266_004430 [Neoarthrinium moseri]